MTAYDEERLADLLRALPPAPRAWVRAAQELPLFEQGLGEIVSRAEADAEFRSRLIADLETALQAEGYEADPALVEALRALELTDGDARAYAAVLKARDKPPALDSELRDIRLGDVLARAAELPLLLAGAACDVAMLGALVAEEGEQSLRADALGAAALASAAAQVAADLVAVNLTATEDDERVARARGFAAEAAGALRSF